MSDSSNTQIRRSERAEAALRMSEATKSAILETALDCIVTIDHQGEVVDWNPAAETTFGYTREEAIGREMAELIIPESWREMHRRGLARAVETGEDAMAGRRMEISARRKNGEEFPVELAISRIAAGQQPMFTGHIRDISERKRAERDLRESQQLLASITQNITEAIFRRSVNEGLLFVNEAYVKLFGYDSAEELRRVPPEALYAEPARRSELVERLSREGVVRNEEVEYRRQDGSTFWGLTSATGLRAEARGPICYFDGAIHDITERKQAEQRQDAQFAVARALAGSASLAEAAPKILQAVCQSLRWDLGTIWEVESRAGVIRCVDLWHRPGLPLADFEKATRGARFPPGAGLPGRIWQTAQPAWIADVVEDGNFPRASMAAICGLHGAFGFPICLGKELLGIIEFFSRQIRQPDAHLLEVFSAIASQIGQFIERKRAEERLRELNKDLERRVSDRTAELLSANAALRESEGRYRTVAQHTPAAIVVLDTEAGRFIEANENAVRLFGLKRAALLQVGPAEVSPAFQPDGQRSATAARAKIRTALRGAAPVFEWMHRRADGTEIPCEVRVARLPASRRDLVIGMITDVTARKQAEAELRSALAQEKELSRLKSNFVNVVSHEFRTPLGVILSSADILGHYSERLSAAQRAGHLQDIRHATQQMSGLMEEVLLLGRVDAGRMELKPEPVDLTAFCQRLVDEQTSATARKCPIRLELETSDRPARGDEAVLRHIFSNLLSNAVKYSPAGAPVRFAVKPDGAEARFEVSDRGIGISAEDQQRLFEAFHRGENVGDIPGTGLGMVIVKRCVDLHGGTIELSSGIGRGTRVVVRLKLFETRARKPARAPNADVRRRPRQLRSAARD